MIGQVGNFSKKEGGTSYHLHFDMQVPTKDGWVFVNPYMTLVAAYERLIGERGAEFGRPHRWSATADPDATGAVTRGDADRTAEAARSKRRAQTLKHGRAQDTDKAPVPLTHAIRRNTGRESFAERRRGPSPHKIAAIMNPTSPRLCCKARSPAAALLAFGGDARAQSARLPFPQWVASFRAARAGARHLGRDLRPRDGRPQARHLGLSRCSGRSPSSSEQTWQYLNRRVSDWRIITGKENAKAARRAARAHRAASTASTAISCSRCGASNPPTAIRMVQQNYMRPVFPALAALAWGEPRRRAYWEANCSTRCVIVERGWSTPAEMRGSWAGAMGHTQWMPEVWLNIGLDYDRDGRVSPFGSPADALAGTARYLVERGKYRRGERWGYEVRGGGSAAGDAQLRRLAGGRRQARQRRAVPAAEGHGAAVGAGAGRPGVPDRPEFLRRAQLQPVDELRAGDRASRATACAAKGRSCSSSPAANARRRSPRCRKSSAA